MGMSEFKPLTAQRVIRDDEALRGPDKAFLWAAVLRTDNGTRKVRASLELLAKDAGYHANTAYRTFSADNKPVMRYFEEPKRTGRSVQLRWLDSVFEATREVDSAKPSDLSGDTETTREVDSGDVWAMAENMSPPERWSESTREVESVHQRGGPSASICSSSATASSPFVRPSSLQGDEQALDTETPSGPLTEEPPSDEGLAAATEVEVCDLHNSYRADSCEFCNQPKRESTAPEWKQKQWHEDSQQENEAPGIDGYPIEGVEIVRLSDVRKRRRSA